MQKEFVIKMQNRIAELAVGSSALRNQGARGLVRVARLYFKEMKLKRFVVSNEKQFLRRLDGATEELKRRFPRRAQHWGTARKAINLFLRDTLYNSFLSKQYKFGKIARWLEIPLDKDVATGILADGSDGALPRWTGIKRLTPNQSKAYQQAVRKVASKKHMARVHLDLDYWRKRKR